MDCNSLLCKNSVVVSFFTTIFFCASGFASSFLRTLPSAFFWSWSGTLWVEMIVVICWVYGALMMISCGCLAASVVSMASGSLIVSASTTSFLFSSSSSSSLIGFRLPPGLASSFFNSACNKWSYKHQSRAKIKRSKEDLQLTSLIFRKEKSSGLADDLWGKTLFWS